MNNKTKSSPNCTCFLPNCHLESVRRVARNGHSNWCFLIRSMVQIQYLTLGTLKAVIFSYVLAWQKLTLCFFRAYLDKTNGHFGILTTAIDIFLDWYNNKQQQEPCQDKLTKAWRQEATEETTMSVPGVTEEVCWQYMFIHYMCLANLAQRKNNIVNTICCMWEEVDS